MDAKRYVILAEGFSGDAHYGKTARGILAYSPHETVVVVDSTRAGETMSSVPIVGTIDEALVYDPTTAVVGVATQGGRFPLAWRALLRECIEAGLDIESGLHEFLGDDEELAALARCHGVELRDLRRPPGDLSVPTGANLELHAKIVLTVGSDCAIGKKTVAVELDREARERGLPSVFCPTGQTGIAIAGWGIAVDAVISDFLAGAAERIVVEGAERGGKLLVVEGQGSLVHPLYSGVTLGLMHGAAPHAFVLCHQAGATEIEGCPGHDIPPLGELVELHERVSLPARRAKVAAIALNTAQLDEQAAREAIADVESESGLPCDDPVRFGAARLLDAVLVAVGEDVTDFVKLTCLVAVLCACVAALAAAPADATPRFGIAEDATKYAEDGGMGFYQRMKSLRMTENRIAVRWNPLEPTEILEKKFLDRAVPIAEGSGIRTVFDVFAIDPLAFGISTEARATLFGAYLQKLARTYPEVTDFIIANEPNEAFFWRPQFGPGGEQASAADFLRVLTRAYDALKAVNPGIRVIAAGLSGEGNDRTSTSPVRFLDALGDAYRKSGRSAPVMDALGFHVYPQRNDHPPSRRYAWPNAGGADLARIKQAVWDAFNGTGQPMFPEGPAKPSSKDLGLVIGEFGWQVAIGPGLAERYNGKENVPTITEAEQAEHYSELIGILGCDPTVTDALLLHLVDDPDLGRFQTGLLRLDLSERPSYAAVRKAIAAARGCTASKIWRHATGVVGAKAIFAARDHPARKAIFGISTRAAEEARAKAGMFRVRGRDAKPGIDKVARSLSRATRDTDAVMTTTKLVRAGHKPRLEFRGQVAPGYYVYGLRLTATMSQDRSKTFVSRVFRVG